MNVDDLAGSAAPGAGKTFFHSLELLNSMTQVRTHAHDACVSPHQGTDRTQQVINVLVVGVVGFGGGVVMRSVGRGSARFLLHADSGTCSEDDTFEQRITRKPVRSKIGRASCRESGEIEVVAGA